MKKRQKAAWFLSGVLVTVMAVSITSPALAALATKTIQVATGVNLYINDQKLDAKDPNGNPVEPFILDGTTYLPVRAVSEALGVPIQWEGSTWSVYVGKHTSDKPAVMLKDMDYFSGSSRIGTADSERDNLGNTHYNCITYSFDRTYILNGQYSKLKGVLYQTYAERSTPIRDAGLSVYADGRLIYNYNIAEQITGLKPVDFDIDLSGVLELRVVFDTTYVANNLNESDTLSLGDVGLYT